MNKSLRELEKLIRDSRIGREDKPPLFIEVPQKYQLLFKEWLWEKKSQRLNLEMGEYKQAIWEKNNREFVCFLIERIIKEKAKEGRMKKKEKVV